MSERTARGADSGDPPGSIALLLPSLAGGGVARVALNLAEELIGRGERIDLVLCSGAGAYSGRLPTGVRSVLLRRGSRLGARRLALAADPNGWRALLRPVLLPLRGAPPTPCLGDLVRYLQRERPAALLSAKTHTNLVALWAGRLAGTETRVVVSQHSVLSQELVERKGRKWRWRFVPPLVARAYAWADAIVAVSSGVAEDLAVTTLDDPWFEPGAPPVVLSAGRLRSSKGFATLLTAFARVRRTRAARLVVLGEGRERDRLLRLSEQLGVEDDVRFSGFVANPFAYMSRARLFALSSRYEALPSVLVEALACGCPVVATDSPGGTAEILAGGRFGRMVPVGDAEALADAITATLDMPEDRERSRRRAQEFSASRAADRYLAVLKPGVTRTQHEPIDTEIRSDAYRS
jgi:glycosyltransferase involved in cell wall biosynthesis